MTRLGLMGSSTLVLALVVWPLSCGGDAFTTGGGDDGGSSSGGSSGGSGSGSGSSSGADAQGDDGSVGGDASPDGTLPEGAPHDGPTPVDAPQEAPPGNVVYVSTTSGNDGNDGTDPSKPKKTIASALTRAQSITSGPEVHVCKGVYQEKGLSLTQTLQLLGGYDCTSWKRTPTYGYPTFDTTNLTTVQNADPTAQAATLLVTGGVAPSAVIDGFVIQGSTSQSVPSIGVETTGSASPVLQNDQISGGAGNGSTADPGSIGVLIAGGSPEVRSCLVSGGSGKGSTGSTGIAIGAGGTPYVHDAIVSGGTGTAASNVSSFGAIGIAVTITMQQANALKNLVIAGSDDAGANGSTIAVAVGGSGSLTVEIEGSAIHGGTSTTSNTIGAGVSVGNAAATVRVLGDRVYGGAHSGSGTSTFGVYVSAASVLNVHNSEIHAGSSQGGGVGVEILGAATSTLVFDTIYTGAAGGAAVSLAQGLTGVVMTDDLLFGGNPNAGQAVVAGAGSTASCNQLTTLDHTAFVNFPTLYACGSTTATTVSQMATALPGASTAGDIELQSTCIGTTTWCYVDPSCPGLAATCVPSVLGASFTPNDDGVTGLFNGPPGTAVDAGGSFRGWTLPPGTTLCAIARGGTPYSGVTIDAFGQTRDGSKPTIGAFEYTLGKCL